MPSTSDGRCPVCGRPQSGPSQQTAALVQRAAEHLAEKALRFLIVSNSEVLAPRIPSDELTGLMRYEVLAKMSPADFARATTIVLRDRGEVIVDEAAWTVALTVAGSFLHHALDHWARAHVAERGQTN